MQRSLLALVLLTLPSAAIAAGPFGHAFSAWDFGQARAETICAGQTPCYHDAFEDTEEFTAWAQCQDTNTDLSWCTSDFRGGQRWSYSHTTGFAPPNGGGDVFPDFSYLAVEGTYDAGTFDLEGEAHISYLGGRIQLALLHYTGDPRDLDGVVVNGLGDLVSEGIATPAQILYSATFTQDATIAETFDVSGIPITEIVIYGYGIGPASPGSVPASSTTAMLVLIVTLTVAIALRTRRR